MAMIDHRHSAITESMPEPKRPGPPSPTPQSRAVLLDVIRKSAQGDIWFGYEASMDTAHVWFSLAQNDAINLPVDDRLALLADDETDTVIGFTMEGFRQEYLRQLPTRDQWLNRIGLRQPLKHDIPMTLVTGLHSLSWPADLARRATSTALDRLIAAGDFEI